MAVPTDVGKNTPAAGAASTVTFVTTAVVANNGKLLLEVGWFSAGATLSSVSATGCVGGIFIQQANGSDHLALAYLDCPNGLASGATVTATFSDATPDSRYICGSQLAGALPGAGYGAVGQNQTASAWSSPATVVNTGDLLFGGSYTAGTNATDTPSGGNTELHDFAIAGDSAMTDVYQVGTGLSLAAQGTWTVSQAVANAAVVVKMATVAFVSQQKSTSPSANQIFQHTITGADIVAGRFICLNIGNSGVETVSTITDTKGNSYFQAVGRGTVSNFCCSQWYSILTTTLVAGDIISITFSATTNFASVGIYEFSGVSNSPLDQTAADAVGTSTTPASGTTSVTTQAEELIIGTFGAKGVANLTWTPGTGFTTIDNVDHSGARETYTEFKLVPATGTQATNCSQTESVAWNAQVATYKAALTTPPGVPYRPSRMPLGV